MNPPNKKDTAPLLTLQWLEKAAILAPAVLVNADTELATRLAQLLETIEDHHIDSACFENWAAERHGLLRAASVSGPVVEALRVRAILREREGLHLSIAAETGARLETRVQRMCQREWLTAILQWAEHRQTVTRSTAVAAT